MNNTVTNETNESTSNSNTQKIQQLVDEYNKYDRIADNTDKLNRFKSAMKMCGSIRKQLKKLGCEHLID